jgi:hypothetical protein
MEVIVCKKMKRMKKMRWGRASRRKVWQGRNEDNA